MRNLKIISIVLLIAVLAFLPTVIKKDSTINLLILVFLYIILASSWNILGGYTGQTSLGHAAFFGLGALVTRQLWLRGFPILPSILAGGLLAVVFALLIGAPAFRLKGVYFSIGTLALAQILNVTVGNVFPEIAALPVEDLINYQIAPRYYLFLGLAIIVIGAAYFLVNSKLGLGMMAVREEEDAAIKEANQTMALIHQIVAADMENERKGRIKPDKLSEEERNAIIKFGIETEIKKTETWYWFRIGVLMAGGLTQDQAREQMHQDLIDKGDLKKAKLLRVFQDKVHPLKTDGPVPPLSPPQPPLPN